MAHDEHHAPSHYVKIWVVLCVLLVISILGPELEMQIVTLITAFGIAFVKAYLVMKHFMHLNVEKPIVWYMLATGCAFMVLFVAGVAPDVHNHDGARWSNVAAKSWVEQRMEVGAAGAEHHGEDHGEASGHGAEGGAHGAEPAAGAGGEH